MKVNELIEALSRVDPELHVTILDSEWSVFDVVAGVEIVNVYNVEEMGLMECIDDYNPKSKRKVVFLTRE